MQNANKLVVVWLLLGSLLGSGPLGAQDVLPPEERSRAAIAELRLRTLVVRLPSHRTKLEAMEEVANNPGTNEAARRRLREQIQQTRDEAHAFNLNAMAAFRENYDFSSVLFMYDHDTDTLRQGRRQGIFLGRDLEIDPAIQLRDASFYFLRFGFTSSGVEAMIVADAHFRDLTKPFPFYQRLNDFNAFMNNILFFFNPNRDAEDLLRVVDKFNKKLYKYEKSVLR